MFTKNLPKFNNYIGIPRDYHGALSTPANTIVFYHYCRISNLAADCLGMEHNKIVKSQSNLGGSSWDVITTLNCCPRQL